MIIKIFLFIENPFLSLTKSCSSSKEGEIRELEDLSGTPSEYRELGDDYYSESDIR